MLSILIPIYNFDVSRLVKALHKQSLSEKIDFEIVLLDDVSTDQFKEKNRRLSKLRHVVYEEQLENIGRARIRNRLAEKAKFPYLLYLDCDSEITTNDFIKKYIDTGKRSQVVYGGRQYNTDKPDDERYLLHWLHGRKREEIPFNIRKEEPNKSFMTNNFMISRQVFEDIKFNEKISGYGHEDTLFGYDLKKKNIEITHIDNPVIHLGLESSEEFLRKTREGIKNLKRIMKINGNEKRLVRDITLLWYYKLIVRSGLEKFVYFLYKKYEYILRRNLLSRKPNLFLFDLYKLGYLCSINGNISVK